MSGLDVAFVTVADLPEGGGNTARLRSLVEALGRAGHRVRIWNEHALGVSPVSARAARGTLACAPFEYVLGDVERAGGAGAVAVKARAVAEIARRMRAARAAGALDVVWFNCLSFYDVAPLTWLARRLGVATVQAYEDERHELVSAEAVSPARRLYGWNARLADRCCPGQADALVVISRYLEEKYAALAGAERVHRIPTLVDCAAWRLADEPDASPPRLLYAGAFGEQDDLAGMLEALARLRAAGRPFEAVLLGANEREADRVEAVRRQLADRGLEDCVALHGFQPHDAVREAIARANVLLAVRREGVWSRSGLSTKLSEYLASGRLVVASAVGDVPDYLRDGENALVVPGGARPERIAEALDAALADPARRRRIAAAGREVARRHFDLDAAALCLDRIVRGSGAGGRRAA